MNSNPKPWVIYCVYLIFLCGTLSQAEWDKFTFPSLNKPIIDEVGLLSNTQRVSVENLLNRLNGSKTVQMGVFIAKSLQGGSVEGFSIALAEKWQLGDKGKDQGIIFVIAPKERKMRIEVGYGLEGDVPDARAKQVLDDLVAPYFRQGQFENGITIAIAAISKFTGADLNVAIEPPRRKKRRGSSWLTWIFFMFWILFAMGRRFRWLPFFGGFGGGYYGGTGYHGRSSGGFGGGGFGGFGGGGGGFGGGGASSSW